MPEYNIAETYTLPSGGEVYKQQVNPVVRLRSMTVNEEMKRLSPPGDYPLKVLCEIIDDCLIENPGISTYDMCVADYQFLLHKLRIVTYGTDYKVEFTCPYCGSQASEVINLADILVKGYNPSIEKYLEFDLPKTNKHAKIRMQTPRLIDAANVKAKQFKKMSPDFSGDPAFIFTLESLIETIDGKPLDQTRVIETIRNMPMADVNTILNQTAKFNEGMGLDCLVTYVCDTCGLSHTGMFRQTAEFFRPTSN